MHDLSNWMIDQGDHVSDLLALWCESGYWTEVDVR